MVTELDLASQQVLSTVVYVAGVLSSAPGLPQLKPVLNVLQPGMKFILWKKENAWRLP